MINIDVQKFEEVVKEKKMRIRERRKVDDLEVFICEGYSNGDKDELLPHYKTMYAFAEGVDRVTVGEFFITKFQYPIMTNSDRLAAAFTRAKEFMRDIYGTKSKA